MKNDAIGRQWGVVFMERTWVRPQRKTSGGFAYFSVVAICLGALGAASAYGAQQALPPGADGTIADGGTYGLFDGIPDFADWIFNNSDFEGAITLSRGAPSFEYRVVFEYDLTTAQSLPAVTATLTFQLRGGTRFPAESAPVQVQAYPADVIEKLSDFGAGPSTIVATRLVAALQETTTYTINVSAPVAEALRNGARGIGFRFQVAPDPTAESNQAFMDAVDSDPTTKPVLTITGRLPGDLDGDGDVDLLDYRALRLCVLGPSTMPTVGCVLSDLNADSHVDLRDVALFIQLAAFSASP